MCGLDPELQINIDVDECLIEVRNKLSFEK